MPSQQEHLWQYRHNASFVTFLRTSEGASLYMDWEITAMFYTLLHLVDAILVEKGFKPNDHQGRNGYVNRVDSFRQIRHDYMALASYSHAARYGVSIDAVKLSKARGAFQRSIDSLAIKL